MSPVGRMSQNMNGTNLGLTSEGRDAKIPKRLEYLTLSSGTISLQPSVYLGK